MFVSAARFMLTGSSAAEATGQLTVSITLAQPDPNRPLPPPFAAGRVPQLAEDLVIELTTISGGSATGTISARITPLTTVFLIKEWMRPLSIQLTNTCRFNGITNGFIGLLSNLIGLEGTHTMTVYVYRRERYSERHKCKQA